MPAVVGVRLRDQAMALWCDPAGVETPVGADVVVRTDRGEEVARVVESAREIETTSGALKRVIRVATDDDVSESERLRALEADAMAAFRERVKASGLEMKPVDVEYALDGSKAVFRFAAEERVDFRDLVRDLSSKLDVKVDMRQVGVRDQARTVGGVGHCGQLLCCVRFGGDFQPVSIRMAKEQDLPLNPLKISGLCGRLMCCLRYEYDAYKDFRSRSPKRGAMISTPRGDAKVTDVNTPKERVTLRFEDGSEAKVPVASLECCKGAGCPCSLSAEALDEIIGAPVMLAAARVEAPTPPAEKSEPRRSRRGGRSKRGSGGVGQSPPSQPKRDAQAGQPEPGGQASQPAEQKSGQPRRRRRRRRPGGSGGGASSQGV